MHVLYIVQHFATPSTAGSSRAFENARRLIRRGHRVTMLCGRLERNTDRDVDEARAAGIELHMAPVVYSQKLSYVQRLWVFRRYMKWAVRTGSRLERPDVVFASSTPLTVGDIGRRIAARHGVPFVFEVRDLWPEVPIALGALRLPPLRWMARRMAARTYAAATRVVALSTDMARVIETWGVPADRVSVGPNACDIDAFGSAEAEAHRDAERERRGWQGKFVAIHPGAMGRVNGLDYVLDAGKALDRMGEDGIVLALVGEGSERPRLEARIAAEGIRSVAVAPAVPKRTMPAVLAAADVGLVTVADRPYLDTNSANKFFDFLAAGRPIVLNYAGWQASVLGDSGAGVAVSPSDPGALAAALRRLRDEPETRTAMGRSARRLAETQFARERLVDDIERALRSAIEEGRSRQG